MEIITDISKGEGVIQFDGELFKDYNLLIRKEGKGMILSAICKKCVEKIAEIDFYYHPIHNVAHILQDLNNHSCNVAFGVRE